MKKRIIAFLLTLGIIASFATALADTELPDGWWPVWSAYQESLKGDNADDILAKGDAVIDFYSRFPMNTDIANQLYMVYYYRLQNLIFENRGLFDKAITNTQRLRDICRWYNNNGGNYDDMLVRCNDHLRLLEPQTGVYAVSYTQNNTYNSTIAAPSGTYYGTVAEGAYGDGSICSFYIDIENENAGQYDWLISDKTDGKRVIQINLNFKGEGNTARALPSGAYDSSLRTTFEYLAKLENPVIVRIGAEMDVWTVSATPAEFIAAYNYVGRMARSIAPNVELVWSPNHSSAWNVDIEDYYPDNSLVDWVGLSLYCNWKSTGSELYWIEHVHAERFADPIVNAENVISVARAHNKPVAITEGGTAKNNNNGQGETYAAKLVAKEFSTLTMVYPEVKSIIYFDKDINGNDYRLTGSVLTAANEAVASNPTLIAPSSASAGTYIPLERFSEAVSGYVVLGAAGRTYNNMDMKAAYILDGKTEAALSGSPNQYRLNVSSLGAGKHKLEVVLDDGKGYTEKLIYTLGYANGVLTCTKGYVDANPFKDAAKSDYFYDAVIWAYENGITTGTSATEFSPFSTCTRGQVVTFLWRTLGKPEPSSTKNPFSDVKADDYCYKPILWAVEKGITNGTSETEFSPNDNCTNAQIITFIWRALGKPADTGSDVWYLDAVNWAKDSELLSGTGSAFENSAYCPRANVVTYLYRALVK